MIDSKTSFDFIRVQSKLNKLVDDFMLDAIRTAVRFRPSPQEVTTEAVLVPEWLMGWIANPLFVSSILTQHSRGYSSIGRALGLQPRGRRFDSYYLHADVKNM